MNIKRYLYILLIFLVLVSLSAVSAADDAASDIIGADDGELILDEAIDDDAKMLIAVLQKMPNAHLPLHDKSAPDEIKQQLGISKAQFKRAVGNLMKNSMIKQVKGDGIYLLNKESE